MKNNKKAFTLYKPQPKSHPRVFLSGISSFSSFLCGGDSRTLRAAKSGMTNRTGRGFTLIELLVVVLIIGILAAVAVPQYKKAVLKAQLVQMRTVFNAYAQAIDLWWLESGQWTKGTRTSFTGTNKNAELALSLPNVTPLDEDTDSSGDIMISAFVGSSAPSVNIYISGKHDGWLNGCSVLFGQFRNHNDTEYRYVGVGEVDESYEANISNTIPAKCADLAKIMCAEWGPTGLLHPIGATQCGVARKPYPDE